jgi:hypothetical protein
LADGDFYVVVGGGGVGTKITSLPFTISAPGFYYLSGNLTYTGTSEAITVNADDVTLDLMGFSLNSNSRHAGMGITITEQKNVEIRNGTVRGFNFALAEANSNGANHRVINVRVIDNNYGVVLAGQGHLIKGCMASNNIIEGLTLGGSNSAIIGNVVHTCGGDGIRGSGTVSGNVVSNCGNGIYFNGAGRLIGNAVVCNSGQTGFFIAGFITLVDQNTVSGAGTHKTGGGIDVVYGTNPGF